MGTSKFLVGFKKVQKKSLKNLTFHKKHNIMKIDEHDIALFVIFTFAVIFGLIVGVYSEELLRLWEMFFE